MQKCSYCETTYREIMQTGFVGCEHCYAEISDLQDALKGMYGENKHKGKRLNHGSL